MSNEVNTQVFGGKIDVTDVKSLAQRAKQSAQNDPRGGAPDNSDYLNFSGKKGVYTIGQDKRQIEDDEFWVVNVTSFEEGWVCWKGGRPAASRMANIYDGVPIAQPDFEELGPFNVDKDRGEGWAAAKAMTLRSCDNGQQGYFKINSISGVSSMSELIGAFSERVEQTTAYWPVVSLDVEEFEAQGYKNYKPVFSIEGWLNMDQLEALASGDDINDLLDEDQEDEADGVGGRPALTTDADEDEAPKRSRKAAKETAEKPKGRRRRRAA